MLKNTFKYLMAGVLISVAAVSCKDEFTEADLLEKQQTIDLSIYVNNRSLNSEPPVEGATVTISQNGNTLSATTDASGAAVFPDVQIGGYVYRVEAANFITANGSDEIYAGNFRQGQVTEEISLYSMDDASLATIKGRLAIETDLTNEDTEFAEGVTITFRAVDDQIFEVTTDAEGRYEVMVPTRQNGYSIQMAFPDLELSQRVAHFVEATDEIHYDGVVPTIAEFNTVFSPSTSGSLNRNVRTDIPTVYATVEAPPAGGTQAFIYNVDVNDDGEIVDVDFSNGGDYTGATGDEVTVTINSIMGGSGATLVIDISNFTNLSSAFSNGDYTLEPGSGYPTDNYINDTSNEYPSISTGSIYVYPGKIYHRNGDYGTGIYRDEDLTDVQ